MQKTTYDKVKELCKQRGLSICGLEKECRIANGTIGKWRTISPKVTTLTKVADFFGVTVDSLVTR